MAQNNTHATEARETWQSWQSCLDGNPEGLILIVSHQALSSSAQQACQASFSRLGWGEAPCIWCTWSQHNPAQLFSLIEGLDPCILIATDESLASELSQAYRSELETQAPCRVFGRPCVVLSNIEALLATPESKALLWRCFQACQRLLV